VLKPLSLEEIKKVHLRATNRWRVPVSFDDRWRPFLNWTKGYHHPRELRLYFDPIPRVLRVAEIWLKSAQSPWPGGRVFIDERGVSRDGDVLLGSWEWPAGLGIAQLIGVRDGLILDKQRDLCYAAVASARAALDSERNGEHAATEEHLRDVDRLSAESGPFASIVWPLANREFMAPGDPSVTGPRWERCPQCPETMHYVDLYGMRSSNPAASHVIRDVYECPRRHGRYVVRNNALRRVEG
jgi:hypothetical protein